MSLTWYLFYCQGHLLQAVPRCLLAISSLKCVPYNTWQRIIIFTITVTTIITGHKEWIIWDFDICINKYRWLVFLSLNASVLYISKLRVLFRYKQSNGAEWNVVNCNKTKEWDALTNKWLCWVCFPFLNISELAIVFLCIYSQHEFHNSIDSGGRDFSNSFIINILNIFHNNASSLIEMGQRLYRDFFT